MSCINLYGLNLYRYMYYRCVYLFSIYHTKGCQIILYIACFYFSSYFACPVLSFATVLCQKYLNILYVQLCLRCQ